MNATNEPALPSSVRTLPQLFAWRVAATPQAEAYRQFDPVVGAWSSLSWGQCGERVARWTRALSTLGLSRGARIAILLPNGFDAVCSDLSALASGFVPVPMHALDNPSSIAYILADSGASLLIAASEAQWQAIAAAGLPLAELKHVFVVARDGAAAPEAGPVPALELAGWLSTAASDRSEVAALPSPADSDLAALVYTSGTTGKPKGVMLSHDNVLSNVVAALARVAARPGDLFLSFLPLSHTFERTAGYYLPMAAGACVVYSRSVSQLADDLRTQRPTVLISVPRIYERVYAKLQERLADSPLKARLFAWAQAVGWRRFCRRQGLADAGGEWSIEDRLAWPVLDLLVGRPLRAGFGGRLRIAVSGGAPLSLPVARCFLGLGVPVLQGYGMTETSPVVAVNAPDDNDPTTVGRLLPGVEARIGDNKELLVRGRNVMRGYWKRDADTARAFDAGWLRTGDQASLEGGRIRIIGRVKEIIVTSTGEKIAPVDVELAITADPLFEQAYVLGDEHPFIACVVVLNGALWKRWATELNLDPSAPASLDALAARSAGLARIASLTVGLPYYARPRAVQLTLEPWNVENGLMTPTLKLKRANLATRFATAIDAMYRSRPTGS